MISTATAIAIALCTNWALVHAASITLTGDAAVDFAGFENDGTVFTIVDNMYVNGPDVGLPMIVWPNDSMAQISGWDIQRVFVNWDVDADALVLAIDCYGICGDADGNGDPSTASMQLSTVGGKDRPDLASGESFAIALDFAMRPDDNTTSHVFDVIVGVPSGQPVGMYELPCSRGFTGDQLLTMARCAGVYDYQATDAAAFSRRFLKETILDNATWPFANAIANTSAEAPDLEWTIRNITALRNRFSTNSTSTSWSFKLRAFGGSFEDAGIGEDYVPGGQAVTTVELSIGESKTTTTVLPASTTSSNIATEESTQAPNEQPTTTTTTTTTSTTTTTTTIDSMSFEATTGIATSSSMDSTESSTTLEVIAQASSTSADVLTTTFDENSNSSSVGEAEEDADDEDDDQNSAAWRALATSILIISTTFHINGI